MDTEQKKENDKKEEKPKDIGISVSEEVKPKEKVG